MAPEISESFSIMAESVLDRVLEETPDGLRDNVRGLILDDLVFAGGGDGVGVEAVFLSGLTLAGFRGIGRSLDIPLAAQPGLTVITARNGTGKSSIVEAAEVLLCGSMRRFQGTQNDLAKGIPHKGVKCELTARLVTASGAVDLSYENRKAPVSISRDEVDRSGDAPEHLRQEIIDQMASLHPVLGAADFQIVAGKSGTEISQHLADVVGGGLEVFVERHRVLSTQLRQLGKNTAIDVVERFRTEAQGLGPEVQSLMESLHSSPAVATVDHWSEDHPQGQAASRVAVALWDETDLSSVETALAALSGAAIAFKNHQDESTNAVEAVAELIDGLLAEDESSVPECPVCGRVMVDGWRDDLEQARQLLDDSKKGIDEARREYATARSCLDEVLPRIPRELGETAAGQAVLLEALAAQREALLGSWHVAEYSECHVSVADFVRESNSLRSRLSSSNDEAAQRSADQAALIARLRQTLVIAEQEAEQRALLRQAIDVIEAVYSQTLSTLLESPGDEVAAIFNELCGPTGVTLRRLGHNGQLPGQGKRPNVELDLEVRGEDGTRGMLSLGQLSALALGFFLQRCARRENAIRFMILDDPVGAMDEVRIDSLVRLLSEYALNHAIQVVILTHDTRIEKAARALGRQATLLRLRNTDGVMSFTRAEPAADRLLRHAWTAIESGDDDFCRRVVPILARQALEAAILPEFLRRNNWDSEKWEKQPLSARLTNVGFSPSQPEAKLIEDCNDGAHRHLRSELQPRDFLTQIEDLVKGLATTVGTRCQDAADD